MENGNKMDEERGLGKFYTHRTYWRQERQRKALSNLPNVLLQIDSRTGIRRNSKKTTFTKSFKGEEIGESYDHPCQEGIRHIEIDKSNLDI